MKKIVSAFILILLLVPFHSAIAASSDERIEEYKQELLDGGTLVLFECENYKVQVLDLDEAVFKALATIQALKLRVAAAERGEISEADAKLKLGGWASLEKVITPRKLSHPDMWDKNFEVNHRAEKLVGPTVDNNDELAYMRMLLGLSVLRQLGIQNDDVSLILFERGGETDKFGPDPAQNRVVTVSFSEPNCQKYSTNEGPCFKEVPIPDAVFDPNDLGLNVDPNNVDLDPNSKPTQKRSPNQTETGWATRIYDEGNTIVYEVKLDPDFQGDPGPVPNYVIYDRIAFYGVPGCRKPVWYAEAQLVEKRVDGVKVVFPMPKAGRLDDQHFFNMFRRDPEKKKKKYWYIIGSEELDSQKSVTTIPHWFYRSGRDFGACFALAHLIKADELDHLGCVRQKQR